MKPVVRNIGLILLLVVFCLCESNVWQISAQKKSRTQPTSTPETKDANKRPEPPPSPSADLPLQSRETPSEILSTSRFIRYSANSVVDKVEYGPPISYADFRNPKFISSIYEHRWDEVPHEDIEKVYFLSSVIGELSERCPNLAPSKDGYAFYNLLRATNYDVQKEYGKTLEGSGNADVWASFARISTGRRSPDAVADTQLFLKKVRDKYKDNLGCAKPETKNFAQSLVTYAEFMPVGNEPIPPGDTVEYRQLIKNCRQSLRGADFGGEWCGCYAKAVATAGIKGELLEALAANPFIDVRTYLWGVEEASPSFSKLVYECSGGDRTDLPGFTTACLLKKEQSPTGTTVCTYSSAFGDFTVQEDVFNIFPHKERFLYSGCIPVITSSDWGTREVSCSATGVASITPPREFRQYVDGNTTRVDYESPVARDFVPPIPSFSTKALEIRVLKQETLGSLREIDIASSYAYIPFGHAPSTEEINIVLNDYRRYADSSPLLICYYNKDNGAKASQTYWFREIPALVLQNKDVLASHLPDHPMLRLTARTQCPARHA